MLIFSMEKAFAKINLAKNNSSLCKELIFIVTIVNLGLLCVAFLQYFLISLWKLIIKKLFTKIVIKKKKIVDTKGG